MSSITIFVCFAILSHLLIAAAIAAAAKAVGSARGRFFIALVLIVGLTVVGIVLGTVQALAVPARIGHCAVLAAGFAGTAVQLLIVWLACCYVFRLRKGRALAPAGACVGASIALTIVAVLVIRPYVVEAFVMPTAGTSPTVVAGDRIAANKLLKPRRLDVIAYRVEGLRGGTDIYLKRLIGLPGERLRFEGTSLFVNDKPFDLPPPLVGRCRVAIPHQQYALYRDGETIALADDEIFVIGDNVDHSADSRTSGPSKWTDIVGVVDARYWPLNRLALLR